MNTRILRLLSENNVRGAPLYRVSSYDASGKLIEIVEATAAMTGFLMVCRRPPRLPPRAAVRSVIKPHGHMKYGRQMVSI